MKRRLFYSLVCTMLTINGFSQKFPFKLAPLLRTYEVNAIQPIKLVSNKNEITGDLSQTTYTFVKSVVLQGITFNEVFLFFNNDQLVNMFMCIEDKGDISTIVKTLSTKYKKVNYSMPGKKAYKFRNGDVAIRVIETLPEDSNKCAGYLYYDYEQSDEL